MLFPSLLNLKHSLPVNNLTSVPPVLKPTRLFSTVTEAASQKGVVQTRVDGVCQSFNSEYQLILLLFRSKRNKEEKEERVEERRKDTSSLFHEILHPLATWYDLIKGLRFHGLFLLSWTLQTTFSYSTIVHFRVRMQQKQNHLLYKTQ